MKLSKLYSVFAVCPDEDTINTDSARVRPCVKRSGTHKSPKRARCRVTPALRASSVGVAPLKTKKIRRLSQPLGQASKRSEKPCHAVKLSKSTREACKEAHNVFKR